MAWEIDSKRSIYSQLLEIIMRRIVTGVYPAGSKLDSVRDLAQEAGVNPNTMQRALMELENTGIINTQRTSGKFVTDNQELIDSLRENLAKEVTQRLIKELKELGFDAKGVVKLVEEEATK